jgi:Subtilase family
MTRAPLYLFLCTLVCACSPAALRIESRAATGPMLQSPEHYIIAAVENERTGVLGHAGSSPRGYDGIATYGPSPQALQIMKAVENDYGLREVTAWPIQPLHMHCAILELAPSADRATVLAALSADARVRLAQPLQEFATRSVVYNDPYVGLQRGFAQMDVANAHLWSRGEGVTVAIIDTGADTRHPDLRGTIAVAANFVDADEAQFRSDRHGTEIAGVIGAVANNRQGIVGIAPGAHLMIFKACWQLRADRDDARCNSFTLAQALVAALDARAQVVNLSLAGPADPLLNDLIREGLRRGVVFVGAAAPGSAAGEGLLHQPGVIEVASVETGAALSDVIYAPGREILTLLPGGRYDFASGNSLATAHVSGAVALLLAKNHRLSAGTVEHLLRASEQASSIDACAAVIALVGRGLCNRDASPENRLAMH